MARKQRGKGEGSITQRNDGRWMGRISQGYDSNGNRKRRTVYGKTKKEVQDKLLNMQMQHAAGTLAEPNQMTVAEWLDSWLENTVIPNRASKTADRYRELIRLYLKPGIGRLKLNQLKPHHIEVMLAEMRRDGSSADCQQKSLKTLKTALNHAIKRRLINANPCNAIEPPKVTRRDINPLTQEQAAKLFDVSESHRLGSIFVVAATTGLRRGELFGLHWSDVNLAEGVLTVRRSLSESREGLKLKEPKSKAGRRAVMLSQIAVDALRRRKEMAEAEGLADRESIIFPNKFGNYQRGSNFSKRVWYKLRTAAGIPSTVKFHDLRHTAASLLLSQNVHPKIVQEMLGHSDIRMTMDIYSHLMPGMQAEAAMRLDTLFQSNGCQMGVKSDAGQPENDVKH